MGENIQGPYKAGEKPTMDIFKAIFASSESENSDSDDDEENEDTEKTQKVTEDKSPPSDLSLSDPVQHPVIPTPAAATPVVQRE